MAIVVLSAGPLAASDQADVTATVKRFAEGYNKSDAKLAAAACTDSISIIDEFPPYESHGAGALPMWFDDYEVDAKKNAISDGQVVLGKPRHLDVEGDRAYVVIPSNYTYKMKGKRMKETGSIWTFALQKVASGCRITAWCWAKN